MHHVPILSQPVPVRDWRPEFPPGTLRSIILHWTAGDYGAIFPAYHFCLSGAAAVVVHTTHDLRANMRDLRGAASAQPYAAHTAGRNSFAVGIAICAMQSARPDDFGAFPLTAEQIDALCVVAATVALRYAIAPAEIWTHAEAAVADGYFGADGDAQRWDIARLLPSPRGLVADEAAAVGAQLRARIASLR